MTGIKPKEVLNQSIEVIATNFRAKRIDAAALWEPSVSRIGDFVGEGIAREVVTGHAFGMPDGGFIAMREDFVKSRPDVVKGWLKAELEAQQFILDPKNWEKVADLVRSQTEGITTRMAWFSLFGAVPAERGGSPIRDEKPFTFDDRVQKHLTTIYTFLFSAKVIDVDKAPAGAIDDSIARSVAQGGEGETSRWGSSSRSTCPRPRSRPAAGRRGKRGSVRPVGPVASSASPAPAATAAHGVGSRSPGLALSRLRHSLKQSTPYVGLAGIVAFVALWYLLTEFFALPRFNKLPGPVEVWREFTSRTPTYRDLAVHARLLQAHPVERLAGRAGVLLGDGARRAARSLHGLEEDIPGLHVPDPRDCCDRSRCSPGCRLPS